MSLKTKMMLACLFIATTGLVTGMVGYLSVNSVADFYNPIATRGLPLIQNLGDLRGVFRELRIQIRSIAFVGTTAKDVEKYVSAAKEQVAAVDKLFAEYEKIDPSSTSRPSYERLTTSWKDFKSFGGVLVEKSKNYEVNQAEIVDLIRNVCPQKADVFYKALVEETQLHLDASSKEVSMALAKEDQSKMLTILFSLMAVGIAVVTSYVFSRTLSNRIFGIASSLSDANSTMTTSVGHLSDTGNSLSTSSSQAAAAFEEIVSSLEELTSMVKLNSDNAGQAASISVSSKQAAESGEKEIHTLIASMQEISKSSKKIEDIISVIDDIAFQTNLLALNAAVEAARAGEQGKGFAVVADAVRTLAQRSAVAAKDISVLIKDSVEKVERGSSIADQSGTVLNGIVLSVKRVADLNGEIAASSAEQRTGIEQISRAMNQLDEASQNNANSARELASISGEINNVASMAFALTADLNHMILGDTDSSPSVGKTEASKKSIKVAA